MPRQHVAELREQLVVELPEMGEDPSAVIEHLADVGGRAAVAMAGPRYFGFVIGGSAAGGAGGRLADHGLGPERRPLRRRPGGLGGRGRRGEWLLDLFGLPPAIGVGFVTGCQMANFTCLAAARHAVLAARGWDVEARRPLRRAARSRSSSAPRRTCTIYMALRYLGLGTRPYARADRRQGRMRADGRAARRIPADGPPIVCAQAGNVNTGAFDPLGESREIVRAAEGAWLHVDGAFGLWAAVTELRAPLDGIERADSWATDAHKWLNVPYDSGLAIVRDADGPSRGRWHVHAAYLSTGRAGARRGFDWVPEFSRRARGFPSTPRCARSAVAACETDRRAAPSPAAWPRRLAEADGVEILNDVVLNQVLVRFAGRRR